MPRLTRLEDVFVCACALWWMASLSVQIAPVWIRPLRYFDLFKLLQSYRFFTEATINDYVIQYCDIRQGTVGHWRELSIYPRRYWASTFWNPFVARQGVIDSLAERTVQLVQMKGEAFAAASGAAKQLARHCREAWTDNPSIAMRLYTCPLRKEGDTPVLVLHATWDSAELD